MCVDREDNGDGDDQGGHGGKGGVLEAIPPHGDGEWTRAEDQAAPHQRRSQAANG